MVCICVNRYIYSIYIHTCVCVWGIVMIDFVADHAPSRRTTRFVPAGTKSMRN